MALSTALRLINDFYLNNNLDKQTINSLLKLIKSLLPKGNLLPSTWKSMNKLLNYTPSTSTTFPSGDCYESCQISSLAKKNCLNPHCEASNQHSF